MPEREVTWTGSGDWVRMGDGDTFVQREAYVVGNGSSTVPHLEARFEVRDGVPECTEFTLRAEPGGRAVRTADLRLFDLDGFVLNTFVRLAVKKPAGAARGERVTGETYWGAVRDVQYAQARRKAASTAELEEVARIYSDNIKGKPTQAVEVGMNYSTRTAARRVHQAREAGLLPKTTPGKKRGKTDQ